MTLPRDLLSSSVFESVLCKLAPILFRPQQRWHCNLESLSITTTSYWINRWHVSDSWKHSALRQAIEQTDDMPVIWNAMMPMWHHSDIMMCPFHPEIPTQTVWLLGEPHLVWLLNTANVWPLWHKSGGKEEARTAYRVAREIVPHWPLDKMCHDAHVMAL